MKKSTSIVYVNFPKVGLGNMLLIWSRALVFSYNNDLPLVVEKWWGIRWGTIFRLENKKRIYFGYFTESSLTHKLLGAIKKTILKNVIDSDIENYNFHNNNTCYIFKTIAPNNDLFKEIREYRDLVKSSLLGLLKEKLKLEFDSLDSPKISIHVRRGDFVYGNPITPNEYFIDLIKTIREKYNQQVSVTVFTDGTENEIKDILQIGNVTLSKNRFDILDILQLSKSKIIILSQSSTFSYWGAFLSDAIILKPINDWQGEIRGNEINCKYPELKIDHKSNDQLIYLSSILPEKLFND